MAATVQPSHLPHLSGRVGISGSFHLKKNPVLDNLAPKVHMEVAGGLQASRQKTVLEGTEILLWLLQLKFPCSLTLLSITNVAQKVHRAELSIY